MGVQFQFTYWTKSLVSILSRSPRTKVKSYIVLPFGVSASDYLWAGDIRRQMPRTCNLAPTGDFALAQYANHVLNVGAVKQASRPPLTGPVHPSRLPQPVYVLADSRDFGLGAQRHSGSTAPTRENSSSGCLGLPKPGIILNPTANECGWLDCSAISTLRI